MEQPDLEEEAAVTEMREDQEVVNVNKSGCQWIAAESHEMEVIEMLSLLIHVK